MATPTSLGQTELNSAVTTLTHTFTRSPASGAVVVSIATIDKGNPGTITAPSGWTTDPSLQQIGGDATQGISQAVAWKLSDGTETQAVWSWTNAFRILIDTYEIAGLTSPTLDVTAKANSGLTNTKTQTSGTTAATSANGYAIAAISVDSSDAVNFDTWSNGFATLTNHDPGLPSIPGAYFAGMEIASGATAETTGTFIDQPGSGITVGDQMAGIILVFRTSSGGAASANVINRMVGAAEDVSFKAKAKFDSSAPTVRLVASTTSNLLTSPVYSDPVTIDDVTFRAEAEVTGLTPNTLYYWGWEIDGVLTTLGGGQCKTFPTAGQVASYSFAYGSCADAFYAQNPTSMTHVLARSPRPIFVMHDGDIHYLDVNTTNPADHRAAIDTLLGFATRQQIFAEIPAVLTWSDHDFCGDVSNRTFAGRDAAVQAFRETRPLYPLVENTLATDPIYQEPFVVGRCVFFMLDCRSMKDPYNSGTDASRTLLGTAQTQWLKDELLLWKNYVKFLISDVPWIAGPVNPATTGYTAEDDHWGAYRTHRKDIADYVNNNGIKNVIIMAGDMHCAAADSGATRGSGVYSAGNFPVFQSAPWARTGSFKGDGVGGTHPVVYDLGPSPAKGTNPVTQQYGLVDITDNGGSTIDVTWRCYNGAGSLVLGPLTVTAVFGETLRPSSIVTQTNDTKTLANLQRDPDTVTGWP